MGPGPPRVLRTWGSAPKPFAWPVGSGALGGVGNLRAGVIIPVQSRVTCAGRDPSWRPTACVSGYQGQGRVQQVHSGLVRGPPPRRAGTQRVPARSGFLAVPLAPEEPQEAPGLSGPRKLPREAEGRAGESPGLGEASGPRCPHAAHAPRKLSARLAALIGCALWGAVWPGLQSARVSTPLSPDALGGVFSFLLLLFFSSLINLFSVLINFHG